MSSEKSQDQKKNPISLYQRLHKAKLCLKQFSANQGRVGDLMLSSTGYPATLLSALLATRAPALSGNLKSLSAAISDYRMFWRVFHTPATIEWALDLLLDNKQSDTFLRWSDYIQAVSGVSYQVLEDIAYLAMKGVLPISSARQADIWVVSCLFWLVHVALELLKSAVLRSAGKPVNSLNLIVNLAWAPLTVHWSTYTGLLEPQWVGLLGSIACVPRLIAALR